MLSNEDNSNMLFSTFDSQVWIIHGARKKKICWARSDWAILMKAEIQNVLELESLWGEQRQEGTAWHPATWGAQVSSAPKARWPRTRSSPRSVPKLHSDLKMPMPSAWPRALQPATWHQRSGPRAFSLSLWATEDPGSSGFLLCLQSSPVVS